MLFVGVCQNSTSKGAEAKSTNCQRDDPLGIEVLSRGIQVWFDLFGGEYAVPVAFSDHEGALFVSPVFPWHCSFLSIRILSDRVGTYPWHYLIYIQTNNPSIIQDCTNIYP